jgi:hypothetical protein
MIRIVVCSLVTFLCAAQGAQGQFTPTISWDANQPSVNAQFQIVGSGSFTRPPKIPPTVPPTSNWSVAVALLAMHTETKRVYQGLCEMTIEEGQINGTWNGSTQALPNGNYKVWVILTGQEGTGPGAPRPRYFTASIVDKAVAGSPITSGAGGTIAFSSPLTRNGTIVSSTDGVFTLKDSGAPPPHVWYYSLAPVPAPIEMLAFPTPGGEVLKGTVTIKPNNKWDGSVSNVPSGFLMLGTMSVQGHLGVNGDDHIVATGFQPAPK